MSTGTRPDNKDLLMTERITSFPSEPPFGTTHYEHGRSWEYVEPGMWKSIAGAGATMDVYWDDILNKPTEFPPEDHQHLYPDIINDDSGVSLDADLNSIRDKVSQIDQELGSIAGNLAFSGTVMVSTGVIDSLTDHGTEVGFVLGPIPTNPPEGSENSYFICEDDGVFAGMNLTGGDWLISEGRNKGWSSVNFSTSVNVLWDDVGNKPDVYPPAEHIHMIDEVFGLQDALDNAGADAYDDTQIKKDLQDEVDARQREDLILQNQIDDIDSFPEAPVDGELYGRKDKGWVQVPDPTEPYDDTEIRSDLADEVTARTEADAAINERIDNLDLSGGGGDDYGFWKVQGGISDAPLNVTSESLLTFEGANGIDISRSGNYITFSYQGADLGDTYDNYQYWRFAVDGFNTTSVTTGQTIDFRAGDNISLAKSTAGGNFVITISAEIDGQDVDLTGYYTKTESDARYEPKFSKNNAFNKNFGTSSGTVAQGNHNHDTTYIKIGAETDPTVPSHVKSITTTDINRWNNPPSGGNYSGGNGISIAGTVVSMSGAYKAGAPAMFETTGNESTLHLVSGNGRGAEVWLNSGSPTANKYMRANPNGNWEIVNGGYSAVLISVNNNGDFTATGDIAAYSDERLKSDVKTLDGSKVYDMRGVSFTKDGKDGSGVIAQELQKVAPELVNTEGDYLAVAYGNLVGYLIEAVKDLKAEVEELKRDR